MYIVGPYFRKLKKRLNILYEERYFEPFNCNWTTSQGK